MYVSFALIYWLTLSLSLCLNVRQKLGTKNTQYSLSLSVSLTHSLTHLIIHSPTHMTYDLMTYDRLNMSDLVLTEHVWSCSGWENLLQRRRRRRRRTKRNSMGLEALLSINHLCISAPTTSVSSTTVSPTTTTDGSAILLVFLVNSMLTIFPHYHAHRYHLPRRMDNCWEVLLLPIKGEGNITIMTIIIDYWLKTETLNWTFRAKWDWFFLNLPCLPTHPWT